MCAHRPLLIRQDYVNYKVFVDRRDHFDRSGSGSLRVNKAYTPTLILRTIQSGDVSRRQKCHKTFKTINILELCDYFWTQYEKYKHAWLAYRFRYLWNLMQSIVLDCIKDPYFINHYDHSFTWDTCTPFLLNTTIVHSGIYPLLINDHEINRKRMFKDIICSTIYNSISNRPISKHLVLSKIFFIFFLKTRDTWKSQFQDMNDWILLP